MHAKFKRVLSASAAAVVAVGILMQPFPALSKLCPTPAERTALDVRVLQTKLMVAALSCNAKAEYNSFVQRFQTSLSTHGYALKRLFRRAYGQQGRYHLNRFMTRLANDASSERIAAGKQYCSNVRILFDQVLNTHKSHITKLATKLPSAGTHGISCPKNPRTIRR